MVRFLTLILICQLLGEFAAKALELPVPGPVVGMVMLFVGLVAKGGLPDDLGRVADGLLSNLSLLFVPAGVGVILHVGLIEREWPAITLALVASTLLAMAAAAGAMALVLRLGRKGGAE